MVQADSAQASHRRNQGGQIPGNKTRVELRGLRARVQEDLLGVLSMEELDALQACRSQGRSTKSVKLRACAHFARFAEFGSLHVLGQSRMTSSARHCHSLGAVSTSATEHIPVMNSY